MPHCIIWVCGDVSCLDGSNSLLIWFNSHLLLFVFDAATEMFCVVSEQCEREREREKGVKRGEREREYIHSSISPSLRRLQSGQRWRIQGESISSERASTRWWHPWVSRRAGQTPAEGMTHSLPLDICWTNLEKINNRMRTQFKELQSAKSPLWLSIKSRCRYKATLPLSSQWSKASSIYHNHNENVRRYLINAALETPGFVISNHWWVIRCLGN